MAPPWYLSLHPPSSKTPPGDPAGVSVASAPWLDSVSMTHHLTIATVSVPDHSCSSHPPSPPTSHSSESPKWDSPSRTSSLCHATSSPHTFLTGTSLSTLLSVQLKTKDPLSSAPNVLSTFVSTEVNTSKSQICSPFPVLTTFTEASNLSLASLSLAYFFQIHSTILLTRPIENIGSSLVHKTFLVASLSSEIEFEHGTATVSMAGNIPCPVSFHPFPSSLYQSMKLQNTKIYVSMSYVSYVVYSCCRSVVHTHDEIMVTKNDKQSCRARLWMNSTKQRPKC